MSPRSRTAVIRGSHRSWFATGFFALFTQPRASQPRHQPSRKQFTTYVESLTTTSGPSRLVTAERAAWISIRWLVVDGSAPVPCRPSCVAHAQPPGPGLPEHAPSVQTSRAPAAAGIGSGRVRVRVACATAGAAPAFVAGAAVGSCSVPAPAHVTCAQRCPALAISVPGLIGAEQTPQVVAYLAVSGTASG
jgi:hypothetical protein